MVLFIKFHNIRTTDRRFLLFQVEEYKNDLITQAETLILTGFPEKILQLNDLLATPMFQHRDFDDVYQDLDIPVPEPIVLPVSNNNNSHEEDEPPPSKRMKRGAAAVAEKAAIGDQQQPAGTKVMALPHGLIKTNTPICEVIKVVKPVIRKLVEDCEYQGNKIGD